MSFGSNRRADRTNRAVLTVIGLVLVGISAAGLITSFVIGDSDDPIVSADGRRWLLDHAPQMAAAGAAVAVVSLALALLWLRHQLRPIPEAGDTTVTRTEGGATVLRTDALTDVVEQELNELRGVTGAGARIRANDPDTIDVLLDVDDSTSLARVAAQISSRILPRARRATGNGALRFDLECRPGRGAAPPRVA